MKCPVCGAEESDTAAVCTSCGTVLDRTTYDINPNRVTSAIQRGDLIALTNAEAESAAEAKTAAAGDGAIEARCLLSTVLSSPVRLEEGNFYRIGRDKTSDICFPSTHVSRLHAEVTHDRGGWAIADLGSRNGTFVNGQRTLKKALRNGDRIGIGHFEIVYKELSHRELEQLRGKKHDKLADTLKLSQDEIGFFGDVRKLSVVEVVQLLGQNRKTGILAIQEEKGAPERKLAFVDGAIVHAEYGSLDGERAVPVILATRNGKFMFRPTDEAVEKITVETPTSTLLFQAIEALNAAQER